MSVRKIIPALTASCVLGAGCSAAPPASPPDWNSLCSGVFKKYIVDEYSEERFDKLAVEKELQNISSPKNLERLGERLESSPRTSVVACDLRSGRYESEDFRVGFEWVHDDALTSLKSPKKKIGVNVLVLGDHVELRMPTDSQRVMDLYAKCIIEGVASSFGLNAVRGTLSDEFFEGVHSVKRTEILVYMSRAVLKGMGCQNEVKLREPWGERGGSWA